MGSVYGPRTKVSVTPFNGSTINYGFATNCTGAEQGALGQTQIANVQGIIVYGTSAPKPGRMTKEPDAGPQQAGVNVNTTSYVDWQSINSAEAAGWKLVKGATLTPKLGRGSRSVRVKAEIAPSLIKVWDMKTEQFNRITAATLAEMGISAYVQADANNNNVIQGDNKIEGASVFGARSDEGLSVGFIAYQRVDNMPAGWAAYGRAATNDPRVARQ
ncbi:MAG: hypothetical protein AAF282_05495 [Cyanobacteria bacterium P01_A01_bin.15]